MESKTRIAQRALRAWAWRVTIAGVTLLSGTGIATAADCTDSCDSSPTLFDTAVSSVGEASESGLMSVDDVTGSLRAGLPEVAGFAPIYRPPGSDGFMSPVGKLGVSWHFGPPTLLVDDGGPNHAGSVVLAHGSGEQQVFVRDKVHVRGEPDRWQHVPNTEDTYVWKVASPERNLISSGMSRLSLQPVPGGSTDPANRIYVLKDTSGSRTYFAASRTSSSNWFYVPTASVSANGGRTNYIYENNSEGRPERLIKVSGGLGSDTRFDWVNKGEHWVIERVVAESASASKELASFEYEVDNGVPYLMAMNTPDGAGSSYSHRIAYYPAGNFARENVQLPSSIPGGPVVRMDFPQPFRILKAIQLPSSTVDISSDELTSGVSSVTYELEKLPGEYYFHQRCRGSGDALAACVDSASSDRGLRLRVKTLKQGGGSFDYHFVLETELPAGTPFPQFDGRPHLVSRATVIETSENRYRRDLYFYSELPKGGDKGNHYRLPIFKAEMFSVVGEGPAVPLLANEILPDCTGARSTVAVKGRQFLSCQRWQWRPADINTLLASENPTVPPETLSDVLGGNKVSGYVRAAPVIDEHWSFRASPYIDGSTSSAAGVWNRTRFAYDFDRAFRQPIRTDRDVVLLSSTGAITSDSASAWQRFSEPLGVERIDWEDFDSAPVYQSGQVDRTESCLLTANTAMGSQNACDSSARKALLSINETVYNDESVAPFTRLPICQRSYYSSQKSLATKTVYTTLVNGAMVPEQIGPAVSCDASPIAASSTYISAYSYGKGSEFVRPGGAKEVRTINYLGQVTAVTTSTDAGTSRELRSITSYDDAGRPTETHTEAREDTGGPWTRLKSTNVVRYPTAANLRQPGAARAVRSYTAAANSKGVIETIDYSATCADNWGRNVSSRARVAGAIRSQVQTENAAVSEFCTLEESGYPGTRTKFNALGLAVSETSVDALTATGSNRLVIVSRPTYDVFGAAISSRTTSEKPDGSSAKEIAYSESSTGAAIVGSTPVQVSQSAIGTTAATSIYNRAVSWSTADGRLLKAMSWQPSNECTECGLPLVQDGRGNLVDRNSTSKDYPRTEFAYVFDPNGGVTTTVSPWARASVDWVVAKQSDRTTTTDMLGRQTSEKHPELIAPVNYVYDPVLGRLDSSAGNGRAYRYEYDASGRMTTVFNATTGALLTETGYEPLTGQVATSINHLDDGVYVDTLFDFASRPMLVAQGLPMPQSAPVPLAPSTAVNRTEPVEFRWQAATDPLRESFQLVIYNATSGEVEKVHGGISGSASSVTLSLEDDLEPSSSYTWSLVAVRRNKTVSAAGVMPFATIADGGGGTNPPPGPSTQLTVSRVDSSFPDYTLGSRAITELVGNATQPDLSEVVELFRKKDGNIVANWSPNAELTLTQGQPTIVDVVLEGAHLCGTYEDTYRLQAAPTTVISQVISYRVLCGSVQMSSPANGTNYVAQESYSLSVHLPPVTSGTRTVEIKRSRFDDNNQLVEVSGWATLNESSTSSAPLVVPPAGVATGRYTFGLTTIHCGRMQDEFRVAGSTGVVAVNEYTLDCGGEHYIYATPNPVELGRMVFGAQTPRTFELVLQPLHMPATFRVLPSELAISFIGTRTAPFSYQLKNYAGTGPCLSIGPAGTARCRLVVTYSPASSDFGTLPATQLKLHYTSAGGSIPAGLQKVLLVPITGEVVPADSGMAVTWGHNQQPIGNPRVTALDGHGWWVDVENTTTRLDVTRRVDITVTDPLRFEGTSPDVNTTTHPTTGVTTWQYTYVQAGRSAGSGRVIGSIRMGPKPGTQYASPLPTGTMTVKEYICAKAYATWQQCQHGGDNTSLVRTSTHAYSVETQGDNYPDQSRRAWVSLLGVAGTAGSPIRMPDTVLGERLLVPVSLQGNVTYDSPTAQVVGTGDFAAVRPFLYTVDGFDVRTYLHEGVNTRTFRVDAVSKVGSYVGSVCLEHYGMVVPDYYNPTRSPHDRPCWQMRGNGTPRAVLASLPGASTDFGAVERGAVRKLPFKLSNMGTFQRLNGRISVPPPFKLVKIAVDDSGGTGETLVSSLDFADLNGQVHPGRPPNVFAFQIALAPSPQDALGNVSRTLTASICVTRVEHYCEPYASESVQLGVAGLVTDSTASRPDSGTPALPATMGSSSVQITYDHFGRVGSTTSPVSSIVKDLVYGVAGGASEVWVREAESSLAKPLSQLAVTDFLGRPIRYRYGDGTPHAADAWRKYDVQGRLMGHALTAANVSNPLSGSGCADTLSWYCSSSYTYDDRGFITSMRRHDANLLSSGGNNIQWGYSDQGQLTAFGINGAVESYGYDHGGNMIARSGLSVGSLSLPGMAQISYLPNNRVQDGRWQYDPTGEVTQDAKHQYVYDDLGRLKLVIDNRDGSPGLGRILENYIYDAAGMRVRSRNDAEDVYSYRAGDTVAAERRVRASDQQETVVDYISINGQSAATRTQIGGTVELEYQFNDRQGSPAVKWGGLLGRRNFEYSPYGQLMYGERNRAHGYTGHEEDATGLIYMRARYDDPALGRFMAPDPARDFSAARPHSFNLYAYVSSNPANSVDPTGLASQEERNTGTNKNPVASGIPMVNIGRDSNGDGRIDSNPIAIVYSKATFTQAYDEELKEWVDIVEAQTDEQIIRQQFHESLDMMGEIPAIGQACDIMDLCLTAYEVSIGEADATDLAFSALGFLPGGDAVKHASGVGKKARKRTNSHLAGKEHPITGVPFDADGYPDFSSVARETVKIKLSADGDPKKDFRAANKAAGLSRTPEGWTWHHHQDKTTMQLVPLEFHKYTGHDGGFSAHKNSMK